MGQSLRWNVGKQSQLVLKTLRITKYNKLLLSTISFGEKERGEGERKEEGERIEEGTVGYLEHAISGCHYSEVCF